MPRASSAAANPPTKNRVGLSTAIVRVMTLPPAAIVPRTLRSVENGTRTSSMRGVDPAAAVTTSLAMSKSFAGGVVSTRAPSPALRPGVTTTRTTFSL